MYLCLHIRLPLSLHLHLHLHPRLDLHLDLHIHIKLCMDLHLHGLAFGHIRPFTWPTTWTDTFILILIRIPITDL